MGIFTEAEKLATATLAGVTRPDASVDEGNNSRSAIAPLTAPPTFATAMDTDEMVNVVDPRGAAITHAAGFVPTSVG